MSTAYGYNTKPGAALQQAGERPCATWYPTATVNSPSLLELNTSRMHKSTAVSMRMRHRNMSSLVRYLDPVLRCSFLVMAPPPEEPFYDISIPVLGFAADNQACYLFQKLDMSRLLPFWPTNPSLLRNSATLILQDICDRTGPFPLTNAQTRRIQQIVLRVDEFCWLKGLPALPVTWYYPMPF